MDLPALRTIGFFCTGVDLPVQRAGLRPLWPARSTPTRLAVWAKPDVGTGRIDIGTTARTIWMHNVSAVGYAVHSPWDLITAATIFAIFFIHLAYQRYKIDFPKTLLFSRRSHNENSLLFSYPHSTYSQPENKPPPLPSSYLFRHKLSKQ